MGREVRERMGREMCERDFDPMTVRPGEMGSRGAGAGRRGAGPVGAAPNPGPPLAAPPPPPGGPPRLVHELRGIDVLDGLDDRERILRVLHRLAVELAPV